MAFVGQLLAQWRAQLARLRELTDDADSGNQWLWRMRERILSFLISRYGDPAAAGHVEEIRAGLIGAGVAAGLHR